MREIKQVVVIGTGRWAKIMVDEIVKRFDDAVAVYFCASRRADEIRQWIVNQEHLRGVQVVDQIPPAVNQGISVAFVVSSVHEHEETIRNALFQGYHVVAEKPLTISSEKSAQVIELARRSARSIFSTNTYRFASYLENFKDLLPSDKAITRLDILWTDLINEERYGERKNYDPRVPIVMDILPHVVSIFESLCKFELPVLKSVNLNRGGAEVDLHLSMGHIESHVQISRISDKRQRILRVWQGTYCYELDFSIEPGVVSCPQKLMIDPAWDSKLKPIARMLESVMNYFENGVADSRLSIDTAVKANWLIDLVLPVYRAQQGHYLLNGFCKRNSVADPDMRYAILERLQQSRKLSPENVELMFDILDELIIEMTNAGDLKKDLPI
jgi:hypothetical protein